VLAIAVLTGYAAMHAEPLVYVFAWLTTIGGLGVLILMWSASAAVLVFFVRHRGRENAWRAQIAPFIAFTLLSVVLAVTVIGFGELLQVSGSSPFQWLIPVAYAAVAGIGVVWALVMRSARPEAYAAIGRGADGRVNSNVLIESPLPKGSHEPVGARASHY
jgi:predicted membrane protein